RFEAGTKIRLQLLPKDAVVGIGLASYVRPSNDQQAVTVMDLEVRLPVMEEPGAGAGGGEAPQPKILTPGVELAGDYAGIGSISLEDWARRDDPDVVGNVSQIGRLKVKGKFLTTKVTCRIGNDSCRKSTLIVRGA